MLPKARNRSFLQRCIVQTWVARLCNLIMINLTMMMMLSIRRMTMVVMMLIIRWMTMNLINLHVARAKVRKIDTVWIITVKLMWNNMKIPQAKDI